MKRPAFWLFCACWLAVLLAPPLRRMLWIQLSGQSPVYKAWVYGPFSFSQWEPSPQKMRDRFPDDPRVLAVAIEESSDYKYKPSANVTAATINTLFSDEERRDSRAYDALIRRFPQDTWLIARRLEKTLGWMKRTRLGGEFSDPNLQANKAAGIPSPEKSKDPPNYTTQDWHEAVGVARLGQKREPDNAFFDWVLFYLLMMNWRDEEAWRVLSRASHKTDYNRHDREWAQAQIAVQELELGRPLLFEEKLYVYAGTYSFSSNSKVREIGSIVTWEGLKAGRRRGDHRKALQIYSDFARLEALHARLSYSTSEGLVARAMIAQALGVEGKVRRKELTPQQVDSMEAWARLSAYKFARYATKHGRPDLAREIAQLRIQAGRDQDTIRASVGNADSYYGMAPRPIINVLVSWWAAEMVLLLLTLLGALWLALGAALRVLRMPTPAVARRDLAATASIGALAAALCFAIPLFLGAGWNSIFGIGGMELEDRSENLLCILLSGVILPPLIVSLWCCFAMGRRAQISQASDEAPMLWRERWREVRLMPLMNGVALWLFLIFSAAWWMAVLVKNGSEIVLPDVTSWLIGEPLPPIYFWPVHPLWPLACFTSGLLALWARPLFSTAPHEKPFVAYGLRWLHASLGALIVAGSVAYLLALVVSLPLRAEADAAMNQLLLRGEYALILNPPPVP